MDIVKLVLVRDAQYYASIHGCDQKLAIANFNYLLNKYILHVVKFFVDVWCPISN